MPQESTIDLGDLTDKNVGQLKILNAAIFPVKYNDKFYTDLLLPGREELTKLGMIHSPHLQHLKLLFMNHTAFYNDIFVGAVCCRVEEEHKVYIMTLGVLAPYRQLKIGMIHPSLTTQFTRYHHNNDTLHHKRIVFISSF